MRLALPDSMTIAISQSVLGFNLFAYVFVLRPLYARARLKDLATALDGKIKRDLELERIPASSLAQSARNIVRRIIGQPGTARLVLLDIRELVGRLRRHDEYTLLSGYLTELSDGCAIYLHDAWPVAAKRSPEFMVMAESHSVHQVAQGNSQDRSEFEQLIDQSKTLRNHYKNSTPVDTLNKRRTPQTKQVPVLKNGQSRPVKSVDSRESVAGQQAG